MNTTPKAVPLLLAALCAGAPAWAQTRSAEPEVQRSVQEDDAVRIEELRVRGQTRTITVHNKLGGPPQYSILPAEGARDLSQDRRSTGQRVWKLFSF